MRAAWIILALVCLFSGGALAGADPEPDSTGDVIHLKGGGSVGGRLIGTTTLGAKEGWRVRTSFGEMFVPLAQVAKVDKASRVEDEVFYFEHFWVMGLKGKVVKRSSSGGAWTPVAIKERYADSLPHSARDLVRPGDELKTYEASWIDLLVDKDIWLRVGPASQVAFPARPSTQSAQLERGSVTGKTRRKLGKRKFVLKQPTVTLVVRGTYFRAEAGDLSAGARVLVEQGTVEAVGQSLVRAGHSLTFVAGKPPETSPLTEAERALFRIDVPEPILDDMVLVEGGTYRLTRPRKDPWGYEPAPDRKERVVLDVAPFLIDRREVTQGEYATFAAVTGYPVPASFKEGLPPPDQEDRPVYGLTFAMASAYAAWVGKELPTEVQWEAASRGLQDWFFPWGNDPDPARLLDVGQWYESEQRWAPPKRFRAKDDETADVSPTGLRNLVSGVPEWTSSKFVGSPLFDERAGAEPSADLVLRGMWLRHPSTWHRLRAAPDRPTGGLRCVLVLPQK